MTTITVSSSNINNILRFHNYFYNKDLHSMRCNDDTEVSVFELDTIQADLLLNAFLKHFHLKRIESKTLAA